MSEKYTFQPRKSWRENVDLDAVGWNTSALDEVEEQEPGSSNSYQRRNWPAEPGPAQNFENFPELPGRHFTSKLLADELIKKAPTWSAVVNKGSETTEFKGQLEKSMVPLKEFLELPRMLRNEKLADAFCSFKFFLKMPLEIKENIYYFIMVDEIGRVFARAKTSGSPQFPKFLPNVCLTSEATRQEAALVFIRNCQWVLSDFPDNQFFTKFLESFPDNMGFVAVRKLEFIAFQRFPGVDATGGPSADFVLMQKCPGLNYVSLTMHVSHLMHPRPAEDIFPGSRWTHAPHKAADIMHKYDLERLFNCRGIKEVHWDAINNKNARKRCQGNPRPVLIAVCELIRKGFEAQGREVAVTIK